MGEFQEKVDNIKKKVNRTSIYIGRVPEKTKTEFIELSNVEFEKDYGMCLKWLMDFRKGLLSDPNEILSAKIDALTDEVSKLKGMVETKPEQKKKRKTLDGQEH
ncbi:MAG: hypothetical protein CMH64_01790 [Nanoarchaeota archaeon]|nr:hypothetical protein [Nanoarchaeota archaeon]|tara:strand:+ start:991 stop:1302 length:312 start_codon:yes stop_codon:yes gene_type:complete